MFTDCTSDTVNLIQGSASADTLPEMKQIGPIIRELRHKEHVVALVLFGSVARGQARNTSDIDLCIITPADIPQSERWDLLKLTGLKG